LPNIFKKNLKKNFLFSVEGKLKKFEKRKEKRITMHQTISSNVRQLQVFYQAQNTVKPFNWKFKLLSPASSNYNSSLSQYLLVVRIMMQ
jgi:AAA15 family ATPase/GTPase